MHRKMVNLINYAYFIIVIIKRYLRSVRAYIFFDVVQSKNVAILRPESRSPASQQFGAIVSGSMTTCLMKTKWSFSSWGGCSISRCCRAHLVAMIFPEPVADLEKGFADNWLQIS
jgi:hypothetical protein